MGTRDVDQRGVCEGCFHMLMQGKIYAGELAKAEAELAAPINEVPITKMPANEVPEENSV